MNTPQSQDRTIRDLITESHKTALDHGWWQDGDRPILEQVMLMVTELAEAAEEIRNGHDIDNVHYDTDRVVDTPGGVSLPKPEGFLSELADVLIRIGDTVGWYDLTEEFLLVLEEKLAYNKFRPYRHGGKTA